MAMAVSLLTLSAPIAAHQDNDLTDFQTWGNITAIGKFESLGFKNPKLEKFRWWMEGQGRFGDNTSQFTQALIRPGIGYQVHRTTSVWLGYAWAPTAQPFTNTPFDEQRIWQQALWTDRFSFGTLTARSRMEERYSPWQSGEVAYRYRQLVKILWPIPGAPNFGLVAQDEFFVSMNTVEWGPRTGMDNNRAFMGVAYTINKNARTEIGYMNHYLNKRSNNLMDHVLSVNLFLNF